MKTEQLAFIDRHCIQVSGPPKVVWTALGEVLTRAFGRKGSSRFARLLGCEDTGVEGPPLDIGSTLVGFRVADMQPEWSVRLIGRHRFSRYALAFELENQTLCATTHAEFPGLHGALYRAVVIGTRVHVFVVMRILKAVKQRTETLPDGGQP